MTMTTPNNDPGHAGSGMEPISLRFAPHPTGLLDGHFDVIRNVMPRYCLWSAYPQGDGPWTHFIWNGIPTEGSVMTFGLPSGKRQHNPTADISVYGRDGAEVDRWKTWLFTNTTTIRFQLYRQGLAQKMPLGAMTMILPDGIVQVHHQNPEFQPVKPSIYMPAPGLTAHEIMGAGERLDQLFPNRFRIDQ